MEVGRILKGSHAVTFTQMRRAVCQRQLSYALFVFTARRHA